MAKAAGFEGDAIYGPPRPGDVVRNVLDVSKAARDLGWKPWTSLREGIEQTVSWFAQNRR